MAFEQLSPSVYRFVDTCNVYVLRCGNRALLIDSGSGEVFSRLPEIGVEGAGVILHTHHHREVCVGSLSAPAATKIIVPTREAPLLAHAESFWQHVAIYDRYDC